MYHKLIATSIVFALFCGVAQAQIRIRAEAWRDFIGGARSASSPFYAIIAGPNGNQKLSQIAAARGECRATVERRLPPDPRSPNPLMTIGFDSSCNNEGAVSISIWEPTGENAYKGRSEWSLSAADAGIDTMGPVQGVTIQAWMEKVDRVLETAISLDPIAASKLPPWPQGAVIPTLPAGLSWRDSVERELYEAIRAGDYQVYCIYARQITCAADVPARGGRMVPMLQVSDLADIYEPVDAKAALSVLTGERLQLTPVELAAAKARVAARNQAAFERMSEIAARPLKK